MYVASELPHVMYAIPVDGENTATP
jgi:hypothetical protein